MKKPRLLPKWLQTWEFMPIWLHSLEPYDHFLRQSCLSRITHRHENESEDTTTITTTSEDSDDDDDDGERFDGVFTPADQSRLYELYKLNANKKIFSNRN